jgi:4-hydroxythreonine-4-phosphate dehydrogenase
MRTIIGITAGDPAGIGLEVTLKALPQVLKQSRWVLFTTKRNFERNLCYASGLPWRWIESLSQAGDDPVLNVFSVGEGDSQVAWGESSTNAGQEALTCLEVAGTAALQSQIDGIVTAPVNKYSIGRSFHGQTDFLAGQSETKQYAMAFFAPTFKVVLATVHMSLRDALGQISTDKYLNLIRFVDVQMQRLHFPQQRIAVAAINPHAGEGGAFGDEDERILRPAIKQCADEGILVTGPHPADSLYYLAHTGRFDLIIAPYHDQGLVPIKLIAHGESTNVTLGLPFIRTSPDHGTAFDIAGNGVADPVGMLSAMKCAMDLIARIVDNR